MNELRAKIEPVALTLLRITVGVIMVAHGWKKVTDIPTWTENFTKMGMPLPEVSVYLAIAGELGGGLGLLLGLLTPIAALGVFFAMLVAVVFVHLPNGLFAKNDGFEYPLTLMMTALYFFARGGGPFSVDAIVRKKS